MMTINDNSYEKINMACHKKYNNEKNSENYNKKIDNKKIDNKCDKHNKYNKYNKKSNNKKNDAYVDTKYTDQIENIDTTKNISLETNNDNGLTSDICDICDICHICQSKIHDKKKPKSCMEMFICNKCQNNNTAYTKTFCLYNLHLSNIELNKIKYFKNGHKKLYLESDIEPIIKEYYERIKMRKTRKNNLKKTLELRKKELLDKLTEYKLEYRPFGDCYSYVVNGYPDINTVIKNELKRSSEIAIRKKMLYTKLQQLNLSYSESKDSVCYEFINGLGTKSFNEIIEEAKIESFFIKYTDYPLLLNMYSNNIAKTKALNKYLEITNDDQIHKIANDLIEKEFTISID